MTFCTGERGDDMCERRFAGCQDAIVTLVAGIEDIQVVHTHRDFETYGRMTNIAVFVSGYVLKMFAGHDGAIVAAIATRGRAFKHLADVTGIARGARVLTQQREARQRVIKGQYGGRRRRWRRRSGRRLSGPRRTRRQS